MTAGRPARTLLTLLTIAARSSPALGPFARPATRSAVAVEVREEGDLVADRTRQASMLRGRRAPAPRRRSEMAAEEGGHGPVELHVKGNAVEARAVLAKQGDVELPAWHQE